MKWLTIALIFALSIAACGGSDDESSFSAECDSVCSCVVQSGGNADTCQKECSSTIQNGGNQRAVCEGKLGASGYQNCQQHCAEFPTSS